MLARWLQKRRRRWYAVLEIPEALRSRFGKARFVASLQTESLTVAEQRVLPLVAGWKSAIESAKTSKGGKINLTSEAADWRLYIENYKKKGMSDNQINDIMIDTLENLADTGKPVDLYEDVYDVVVGNKLLLVDHINSFIATLEIEQKSIDMKKSDILRFLQKFTFAQDVTKRAVMLWVEEGLMGQQSLALATCRRIISNIRSYWLYLERYNDLNLGDPFVGVVPSVGKKKTKKEVRDRRKSFGVSDFQKITSFANRDSQDLLDLIYLGAYTGCRIEELCSLKLHDVLADRLKIEDAKTEAGWREVPIHPHIKDLVARLSVKSRDGYLIGGLSFNKYGDRSNAIGKRFGRLKSACGYGKDYVFHSFRKGVATQLENAQVPENHVARLLGHEMQTMSYGLYSGGLSFEVLRYAISHLDWSAKG
jgi:integrase